MRGSWRVQSALRAVTLRAAKALTTASLFRATRLLTWQVTHHAAVKSTNTGCPAAARLRTFSGDHACHGSSPARATGVESAAASGATAPGHATSTPAGARITAIAERRAPGRCHQR